MHWFSFIFGIVCFSSLVFGRLLPDEKNTVEVYRKSHPAVVNVTSVTLRRNWFAEIYPQEGVGSGVIIRKSGYIVTNDHVLGGAYKLMVTLSDKTEFPAKVVGRDPDTDLAVIKIDPGKKRLTALGFEDPKNLFIGQKVIAIGNPFGLGGTLTTGVVSALERDIQATTKRQIKGVIQTDAAINPGNSGGPLINSSGNLIGINSQIFSPSGGSVGVGFAIAVGTVKRIVEQVIRFGRVLRPYLGAEGVGLGPPLLRHFKVPSSTGVMLTEIDRRGPAAIAGLKGASRYFNYGFQEIPVGGDIIYQVDNTPVETFREIDDYIFEKKVGETIQVYFFRNGKRRQTQLRLGYPPGVREKSM